MELFLTLMFFSTIVQYLLIINLFKKRNAMDIAITRNTDKTQNVYEFHCELRKKLYELELVCVDKATKEDLEKYFDRVDKYFLGFCQAHKTNPKAKK